jgi:hypothetical protein
MDLPHGPSRATGAVQTGVVVRAHRALAAWLAPVRVGLRFPLARLVDEATQSKMDRLMDGATWKLLRAYIQHSIRQSAEEGDVALAEGLQANMDDEFRRQVAESKRNIIKRAAALKELEDAIEKRVSEQSSQESPQ